MPSGGARVGAGRKPKPKLAVFTPPASVQMPSDLPAEQADCWRRWASLAQQAGTLTEQTVPAFRLLCQSQALLERYWAKVDEDGETFLKVTVDGSGQEHQELKAHPLIGKAQTLAFRVEQLLARFGLAPNGRAVITPAHKPVSKWARFGVVPR